MRKRTPSEVKAYGDGYAEAYNQFQYFIEKHEISIAVRKMKIFADAVALTVETALEEADIPQTEHTDFWHSVTNEDWLKAHGMDTPQTEQSDDIFDYCPRCGMRVLSKHAPQTDCQWK